MEKLVAAALTTTDKVVRRTSIERALMLCCKLLRDMNRDLHEFASLVLKRNKLGDEHAALSLRDLASTHEALQPLASPEALRAFLHAAEPLLVAQLRLSRTRINEVFMAVLETYELFMDNCASVE